MLVNWESTVHACLRARMGPLESASPSSSEQSRTVHTVSRSILVSSLPPAEHSIPGISYLPGPQQLLCNHSAGNHHFMLSPGQFVAWPMKANQAKYCKFAYSSAFTFSVPTGPLIQQIAPDNTLAISRDGGETWAVKWKCEDVSVSQLQLTQTSEEVPVVSVKWYPWADRSVSITTKLISPTDKWPDWHARVHEVTINETIKSLHTVEGGFAINDRRACDGRSVPVLEGQEAVHVAANLKIGTEGILTQPESSILISSSAGLSGVVNLRTPDHYAALGGSYWGTKVFALKPDSNTNLAFQRTQP